MGLKARLTPILAAVILAACASHLPTPAELQARGVARIQVQSLARWDLSAPAGNGYDLQISRLDGKDLCRGDACVGTLEVAAGRHELTLLCMLVTGGLRIPRQSIELPGNFAAGHVYGIQPASATPDCKVTLLDVTSQP